MVGPVVSGSSSTTTVVDNNVSTAVTTVSGSAGATITTTVTKSLQGSLSAYFTGGATTLSAISSATVTSSPSAQPCIVALSPTGSITGSGSPNLTMPNCSLRSNNTIVMSGGATQTTAGYYAASTITVPAWFTTTGAQYPNSGTIPDPYASNSAMQAAFTTVKGLSGTTNVTCSNQNCTGLASGLNGSSCTGIGTGSVTCAVKPGNYGSFQVTSGGPYTFNFAPGLYLFAGNMSFLSSNTINGTGVTIVTSGSFTGGASFNMNLTAPSSAQVASTGGVAGVLLASSSSATSTFSGSSAMQPTGVFYFPNATLAATASTMFDVSSSACVEIIAGSVTLSGGGYFNSNCSSVNAVSFGSVATTTSQPKLSM